MFDIMAARGVLQPFALKSWPGSVRFQFEFADERDRSKYALHRSCDSGSAIAQTQQQAEQAGANLSLSNTITSLRLLGDIAGAI